MWELRFYLVSVYHGTQRCHVLPVFGEFLLVSSTHRKGTCSVKCPLWSNQRHTVTDYGRNREVSLIENMSLKPGKS